MVDLVLYDNARRALAEAHRVDEVKAIRDKAVALQAYARQAKDRALLDHATDIKFRAERRTGEILAETPKAKGTQGSFSGRNSSGGFRTQPPEEEAPATLGELGITKTQSSKWQKLAALPEEKFEIRIEHAKSRVADMTTSAPGYSKSVFTGENEWYTPPKYVDLARAVLGVIDVKMRPKIEVFAEYLPGNNGMSDVDATVELNGHFLFLEFKSGQPRPLPKGQRIYFEHLTKLSPKIVVCVVCANAETMVTRAVMVIHDGIFGQWEICSLTHLQQRVRRWARKAEGT